MGRGYKGEEQMETYYSIHDILKVKTNIELIKWDRIPNHFKVDEINEVDLNIMEGKFDVDFNELRPLGLRLFKGDDFIIYKSHTFGDLKLMIKNLTGNTELFFTKNYRIFNGVFELLGFIVWLKFIQKGYTLIHSACVSKNKKGVLLSAWSDTGKTLTSLSLLQKSFQFLSDDFTLISPNGYAYSYPQIVRKSVFNPFERIPFLNKLKITKEVNIPEDKIDNKAEIDKLFFLEKDRGDAVKEINHEEAVRRLLITTEDAINYSSRIINSNTNQILRGYSYLDPRLNLKEMRERHEDIIKKAIEKASCFEVKTEKAERFPELINDFLLNFS
ncbi:hypothetical protein DRN97_04485 [Methanosarcinales archaeon]|nr:MAG: hypothetical protein DRN97_04485 [Methanosarcinales archaeon]